MPTVRTRVQDWLELGRLRTWLLDHMRQLDELRAELAELRNEIAELRNMHALLCRHVASLLEVTETLRPAASKRVDQDEQTVIYRNRRVAPGDQDGP